MLSVEAMVLGKPVVSYIRQDLILRNPKRIPPICNANPDTLYDVLKPLLQSGSLRQKKGIEGHQFVERYHDSNIVGRQLLELYNKELLRK